jgi:hypothetical protein
MPAARKATSFDGGRTADRVAAECAGATDTFSPDASAIDGDAAEFGGAAAI